MEVTIDGSVVSSGGCASSTLVFSSPCTTCRLPFVLVVGVGTYCTVVAVEVEVASRGPVHTFGSFPATVSEDRWFGERCGSLPALSVEADGTLLSRLTLASAVR